MKQFLMTCLVLLAFGVPSPAQIDHDYNPNQGLIPASGTYLTKDQIPPAVVQALKVDFNIDNPISWMKFPYALQEYGWVYDKGASDVKPNNVEAAMKSKKGNDLFVVYSPDGRLIATREMIANIPVPPYILESLSKSKYKDWKVVGNKEFIQYFHDKNSIEKHFRLTVEKDNIKRSLSFNYQVKE
jgi:hypothetical protein